MSKRRLFSNEDGTTFFEDLRGIFQDAGEAVRLFFQKLFGQIDNWYDLVGEPVVNFLEGLKEVIDTETITGSIFDSIVNSTPTPLDNAFLAWLRSNIGTVIDKWAEIPSEIDDVEEALNGLLDELGMFTGDQRDAMLHSLASTIIEAYSEDIASESGAAPLVGRDADLLAQMSYNMFKDRV